MSFISQSRFAIVSIVAGLAATPALATHIPASNVVVQYESQIQPAVPFVGTIGTTTPPDLYDWFAIRVTNGVPISFTVTQLNGDIDPDLCFFQGVVNNGQTVAQLGALLSNTSLDGNGVATLAYTPNFTGPLSVVVSTFIGEPGGDYSLVGTGFTTVPEPTSLIAAASASLLLRRRRRA